MDHRLIVETAVENWDHKWARVVITEMALGRPWSQKRAIIVRDATCPIFFLGILIFPLGFLYHIIWPKLEDFHLFVDQRVASLQVTMDFFHHDWTSVYKSRQDYAHYISSRSGDLQMVVNQCGWFYLF